MSPHPFPFYSFKAQEIYTAHITDLQLYNKILFHIYKLINMIIGILI